MVSPYFYESFCVPIYRMYSEAMRETDKLLACHMDGHLSHLKNQIADSPVRIIDLLTVPPVGNIYLKEEKTIWPNKIIFLNCPAHLTHKNMEELKHGYAQILEEWDSKRLLIEHVESLPLEELEQHLSAILDVCGYPK